MPDRRVARLLRVPRRLVQWLAFRTRDTELAEEMAFHRDALERDLVARGFSRDAARAAARRAMGNETFMREEARGVWLWPRLEGVWQDATVTWRGLMRTPVFTVGVLLTFALGVGANAAMFSLVDRLMFRSPARMRNPSSVHRVYLFRTRDGMERQTGGQYARHADLVRWTTKFSAIAAFTERSLAVGTGDATREARIGIVSASFFEFFDAPPVIGRYFTNAEDAPPAGAPVAVLSWATWQTQYGARSDVVGSKVQIGPVLCTIIGVTPAGFTGLWPDQPPVAFIPVATYAASRGSNGWWSTYTSFIGIETLVRRKPEVSIAAATADLTSAFERSYLAQRNGDSRVSPISGLRLRALAGPVLAERGPGASSVAKVATWLAGVSILVLLIACANVTNLLLARALSRRREIAVRVALGVSRRRLATQLLTESLLLAFMGSVAGIFVAARLHAAFGAMFFPDSERAPLATDARTLAFVGAVALIVSVLTCLLPLAQTRRLAVAEELKSGARGATSHRSRARAALIVLQGALSLMLLIGAGLFMRSVRHVRDVRIGFDVDSVLLVELNLRGVSLDSATKVALRHRLLEASTTVPGMTHASLQESVPFWGATSWPLYVAGIDSVEKFGEFDVNTVSPDYFATMGTRILRGRGIERGDIQGARRVMVIGQSMADVLWPGKNPIGQCARVESDTIPCTYVVGVAEDIHTHSLGPERRYHYYYLSAAQMRPDDGGLFVRAGGDTRSVAEPLRRRLQAEMPGASYVTVTRFSDIVADETRSWVMGATVFSAFGALALALSAVGLYGMIAYDVAQRKHELAVRVALGAHMADVLRLVVTQGLRLGVSGIVIGGAIALVSGKAITPLLFDESPRDPAVFGVVVVVLLVVTAAASLIPAFRAARMDPRAALQAD